MLLVEATSAGPTGIGGTIGDKLASAIVKSPLYPFLIRQARSTMKKSAEVRTLPGVPWTRLNVLFFNTQYMSTTRKHGTSCQYGKT